MPWCEAAIQDLFFVRPIVQSLENVSLLHFVNVDEFVLLALVLWPPTEEHPCRGWARSHFLPDILFWFELAGVARSFVTNRDDVVPAGDFRMEPNRDHRLRKYLQQRRIVVVFLHRHGRNN